MQAVEEKDEPRRGGLNIERYGEVMAHLRHFGKNHTPEVLERLGLHEDQWEEALFGFTALMVDESEREEEVLSRRFGERFAKTKARLAKEKPELASIGPLRDEKPVEMAPAQAAEPLAPVPPAPSLDTWGTGSPSAPFAPNPIPIVPLPAPEIVLPNPQPTHSPSHGGPSPWAHGASTPMIAMPLPPQPPRIAEAPRDLSSMVPAAMRNFQGIHGTQAPSVAASAQPALPFSSDVVAAEPEAAYRRAKEHGEATEPVRHDTSPLVHAGGETRDISAVVAAVMAQSKKATPFDKRPPAPAPVVAPAPPPVVTPAPAPVVAPAHIVAPAPVSPEPIQLTLEQYASLCVEIAMAPAKKREIAQRYGLSEEHAARVDAHWRARITSDPEIDKSFRWAYHSYQQWLAGRT